MKRFIYILFFGFLILCSCKKESFITSPDAIISTSADTIRFDTVFASAGSVTKFFRIYNDNNRKLRISSVSLAGGVNSAFKINADGIAGPSINNLEIEANDSMYIFASVLINPSSANLPFLVQDSILIQFNGNKKWVQLEAFGQNANFLRGKKITGNVTWTNNLPYVILDGLQVVTNATLTIQQGTKIYLHANAPILVDGTLLVTGDKYDSSRVYFAGDRLDDPYRDFPAGWPGIYFRKTSKDNQLNYAVIRNAFQGVVLDQPSVNANPKVQMNQTIVDNAYDAGIFCLSSSLSATNCLISNCGKNVILAYGGDYSLTHCTVASYSNSFIIHKDPVLVVTNYIQQNNTYVTANLNASFINSIFWGDNGTVDNEVVVSKQGSTTFTVNFQNCLWKVKSNPSNTTFSNMLNTDPLFDSIDVIKRFFNFRLNPSSPAINKGIGTSVNTDLDGNPRPVGLPDLGAYENQ